MIVPFGEGDYYRVRPSIAIPRPGTGDGAAVDLNGFFGLHPRMAPLKPFWDNAVAGDRARLRIAGQHALALRRAGLHGVGHAGRQEHEGRLAEPLSAGGARRRDAADRRRDDAPDAALAAGHAPALAMGSVGEFGVRGGMAARDSFEAAYASAADQVLKGTAR